MVMGDRADIPWQHVHRRRVAYRRPCANLGLPAQEFNRFRLGLETWLYVSKRKFFCRQIWPCPVAVRAVAEFLFSCVKTPGCAANALGARACGGDTSAVHGKTGRMFR
ncbi:MAG: hypothetical protein NTW87_02440 [Planctomycetota bacterium]|nr:hypothetical protein [Planctomycetota bacterium]